ncbi:MAG: TIGR03086 family metal-binding protein, partial [Thermomicrobiales bacterium]
DAHTPRPKGDVTGETPADALRASSGPIVATLRGLSPDTLIASPFGEMPPTGFAAFLAIHILNHGWELAQATGQSTDIDPELSEQMLALAKRTIPGGQRPGAPFDPETAITDTAPAADRLAAYLGHAPQHFAHLGSGAASRDQHQNMGDLVAAAVGVVAPMIDTIQPGQWDLPTPCTEWNLRDLVGHLVNGNRVVAAAFEGGQPGFELYGAPVADPAADFAASSARLVDLMQAPGGMAKSVILPYGTMPATAAAGFRMVDILSHGWDIARALGLPTDFAPELSATALEMARASMQGRPRPTGVFGDEQIAPAGASAADKLAAFLGRVV